MVSVQTSRGSGDELTPGAAFGFGYHKLVMPFTSRFARLPVTKVVLLLGVLGLCVLLLGIAVTGCTKPAVEQPRLEIETHLMKEPEALFERHLLFEAMTVSSWTFDRQAEPWLVHDVDLDAAAVHAVEAVFLEPRQGAVRLYWAGPGKRFSTARSLTLQAEEVPEPHQRFRFEVAIHPEWKGRIDRLRIDILNEPDGEFNLAEVLAWRWEPRPEALAAGLDKSFEVDLETDARNAWLAAPGIVIERRAQVADNQTLSFAVGLEKGVTGPVTFRVEALIGASGDEDPGAPEILFEKTLEPRRDAGEWHEETVDLAKLAGRSCRFRFRTRVATPDGSAETAPLDLTHGFPLWAHPVLLGPAPEDDRPNVILISIDTLRADRLGAYGYPRATTPKIDAWAKRAVLFENTVVQAPWTLPSHASILTGWSAMRHGANQFTAVSRQLETLPEILRAAGYTTAAITGGGILRPRFGLSQGFDSFRYWPRILADEELESGMSHALEWLETHHHRRFFLFFHTYEVHYPYVRREPYFSRLASREALEQSGTRIEMRPGGVGEDLSWEGDYFVARRPGSEKWAKGLTEAEKELVSSLYDSGVAYMDAHLGRFLERIEALGLDKNTLIVLTSDHGEALGEKDKAGHNYLDEHNLMVPLLFFFPDGHGTDGHGTGRRISEQVRSIDILPTLLEKLDLGREERRLDGVSLLGLIDETAEDFPPEAWSYASSANYGLALRYRNRLKYIYNNTAWRSLAGREQLHDLSRDPLERRDLAPHHPETPALREKIEAYIETHHEGLRLEVANFSPGRLVARLEGLGHSQVKTADPSCDCVEWIPGAIPRISLASGQRTTLQLEPASPTMTLRVRYLGPGGTEVATFSRTVQLNDLEEPLSFVLTDGAFEPRQAFEPEELEPPFTGFKLWRYGESAQAAPTRQDPRLLEELRALGYVQ